jgi:hypothetical protein
MGNSPPAPPSPDEIKDQFDNAFNPDKNGFNNSINDTKDKFDKFGNDIQSNFDPNNSNGILGKIKDGTDEAFKKGGIGNQILRKAGDIGNTIAPIFDSLGDGALTASAFLPEFSPILAPIGIGLKGGGAVAGSVIGKLPKVADTIEKDKKDLRVDDFTNIFR